MTPPLRFGRSFVGLTVVELMSDLEEGMDVVVEAVVEPVDPVVEVAETAAGADELVAVRELILKAYPDVVPELVSGSTVSELTASVETARAAYAGIISRQPEAAATPPAVPAGGATMVIDPASLPAAEKIRRGLTSR
jgi:hypothetical protein